MNADGDGAPDSRASDPATRDRIAAIIASLGLVPLESEGGYFAETYRSPGKIAGRPLATAIYYLVTRESPSRLHRLAGDEVYHFYAGDPVVLLLLHPDGTSGTVTLGTDLSRGMRPQTVVPGGVWQGSCVADGGNYALLGTTMSPGFDPADFEAGDRERLAAAYPDRSDWIVRLT